MKLYMNEKELIDELVNNKKIRRDTIPEAIFKERAYTTLINPYKHFICENYSPVTKEYLYKKDGDFKVYMIMAQLDDYLSSKFSEYIKLLEKRLKAFVAEYLAQAMKDDSEYCNNYLLLEKLRNEENVHGFLNIRKMYNKKLNVVNADDNIVENRRRALLSLLKLQRFEKQANNILVKHYHNKQEIPPIWIAVHILTLGDVFAIYNMIVKNERFKICELLVNKRRVRNIDINSVSTQLDNIRKIRNIINHYEPLIPYLMNCEKNALNATIRILKNNYYNIVCQNLRISRKKIIGKIEINDYNKKYIEYIDDVMQLL